MASSRKGRPRTGFDLSGVPPMQMVQAVPVLQQEVVDFLFAALGDIGEFMRGHRLKWCITWGTLLGAYRYRHGGMIPWDFDVDVAVVVQDPCTFAESVVPGLVEFMKAKGHRTLVMPRGAALKIGPKRCAVANLHTFSEAKNRLAEQVAKNGKKMDRARLSSLASKVCVRKSRAFGRNVIDVEMIVTQPDGSACFHNYSCIIQNFGIKTGIPFGNLTVPVPVSGTGLSPGKSGWKAAAEPILTAMYPNGFKVPVYRHVITGRTRQTPKDAKLQRALVPSHS